MWPGSTFIKSVLAAPIIPILLLLINKKKGKQKSKTEVRKRPEGLTWQAQ
jgi:hypothetical protein